MQKPVFIIKVCNKTKITQAPTVPGSHQVDKYHYFLCSL